MPTESPTDAEAFRFFPLADQVKNGGAETSPEELLHTWRSTQGNAIEDIRRGMEDLEAGRYQSFDEVDARIRENLGFKAKNDGNCPAESASKGRV